RRFPASWTNVGKALPWRSYYDLLHHQPGEKPSSYPLNGPGQRQFVFKVTDEFVKFVDGWGAETSDFGENSDKGRSPRPKPALRSRPQGANDPRADGGVEHPGPPMLRSRRGSQRVGRRAWQNRSSPGRWRGSPAPPAPSAVRSPRDSPPPASRSEPRRARARSLMRSLPTAPTSR